MTMKKTSLADALLKEAHADVPPVESSSKASLQASYVAPARKGKKAVTVWFEPDVVKQLKLIGIEKGMTLQDMMRDALNNYFARNHKAQIA